MPRKAIVLYQGALEYALKRKYSQKTQSLKQIIDDEELNEDLRVQLSQIFFFLGITYRSESNYEEAIHSY